jgi:ADP-ribosylation factor GTPase-activating protein 2/3
MGAQKATKSFAEVEREAEMADQIASVRKEEKAALDAKTAEDNSKAMANMRLAYQDLSVQQKKQEEKLAKVDPTKAAQVERLGMGFGGFGGGAKSHSLMSDMGIIKQEEPANAKKPSFQTSTKDRFFDDFEVVDDESKSETPWRTSRVDEICDTSRNSGKSAWEKDLNENMKSSSRKTASEFSSDDNTKIETSSWDNDFDSNKTSSSSYRSAAPPVTSSAAGADDAVKKFGNAKAISSDAYFGGGSEEGRDANTSRFEGSSSISSAEYFGRDEGKARSAGYTANLNAPDLDDVKESVRLGVNKVAGRLSGMASGVMNQIQRVKTQYK